jgi:hypothetical protein
VRENGVEDVPEQDKQLQIQRSEEFESLYANSVQFEASVWDLKVLFGQVDQAKSCIEQHTAVSLSWLQAKIAAYFLVVNILIHQAQIGAINVPPAVLPPRPDPSDPTIEPYKAVAEYLAWVHDQFFGSDPYVPPNVAAAQQPPSTEP